MKTYIHIVLLFSERHLTINEIIDAIYDRYQQIAEYGEVYYYLNYYDGVYDKQPCGNRRYVYGLK